MDHAEFVRQSSGRAVFWGVHTFLRPVRLVWGIRGLFVVAAASLLVLAPTFGFGFYAVRQGHFGGLAWALPALLAFFVGRPNLNCVAALPWVICALIGLVVAIFFGPLHYVGGVLPGITWMLAGALRGTTMQAMQERLRESPQAYDKLKRSGEMLFLVPREPTSTAPVDD